MNVIVSSAGCSSSFYPSRWIPKNPEKRETIYNKVKLFRIDNNLKNETMAGSSKSVAVCKYLYCSIPALYARRWTGTVIASIKLALIDYDKIQKRKR